MRRTDRLSESLQLDWINDYLPTLISLAKGLIYGVGVWLVAQVLVMPMMGAGPFFTRVPNGRLLVLGGLAGHLIYGGVLGFAYGTRRVSRRVNRFVTLGL